MPADPITLHWTKVLLVFYQRPGTVQDYSHTGCAQTKSLVLLCYSRQQSPLQYVSTVPSTDAKRRRPIKAPACDVNPPRAAASRGVHMNGRRELRAVSPVPCHCQLPSIGKQSANGQCELAGTPKFPKL